MTPPACTLHAGLCKVTELFSQENPIEIQYPFFKKVLVKIGNNKHKTVKTHSRKKSKNLLANNLHKTGTSASKTLNLDLNVLHDTECFLHTSKCLL